MLLEVYKPIDENIGVKVREQLSRFDNYEKEMLQETSSEEIKTSEQIVER